MSSNKKIPLPIIKIEQIEPDDESAKKCAPHLEFENGSCYPLDLLIEMAEAYNEYNKSDEIKLDSKLDALYPDEYKRYLLFEFKKRFSGDQKDWIKQKFMSLISDESKQEIEHNVFRPNGPQGKFDWLSTIDINKVLLQYENKYPDFKFLGAVPMDFMDLDYLPFKNLNFKELEDNGFHRIGVIFNTDKSYQPGQHWVSLFFDLKKGQIYYSDSHGIRSSSEVSKFMKLIEKYIKSKGIHDYDIRYNKTVHQKGNSECGVYSINFILRLLKGKTFDHITRKRLADEKVNKCRIKYFGNK